MKYFFQRKTAQAIAVISLAVAPSFALAQTVTLCTISQSALGYFNTAIKIIIGLAMVVFIFNVFRYFFTEKETKERGTYILWGIIGFAVIVCFWGLVNLVTNTFSLNNSAPTTFGNMFGSNASSCTSSGSSGAASQPTANNTITVH